MSQIKELTDLLIKFREERDWKQFHNPKDLAIAISIESSELLEAFLWKNSDVVSKVKIEEEVADVMAYLLLIAAHYELDLENVLREKVKKNELKYPIEKAKGNATKYNEL
jgi:NTP pyrophosphatase (non-canonical NTP hydrolase)